MIGSRIVASRSPIRARVAPTGVATASLLLLAATLGLTPSCAESPPRAYAEALVVVDTDVLVPAIANRLRVDLYAADGTWYESRDIGRGSPADWPASFSVYSPSPSLVTRALVRLRAYPENALRDYRGERFATETGPPPDGARDDEIKPRLVRDGADVTPPREPMPSATLDRLVLLKLVPGERGRVRVTLRGACAGTMARLGADAPYQTPHYLQAETCIDTEKRRVPVEEAILEPDMDVPPAGELGAFGRREGCAQAEEGAAAVCVPGGSFLLGSATLGRFGTLVGATPERLAVLDRFWLDRYEVTVADVRRAAARGFVADPPIATHEGVLGESVASDEYALDVWCTYSAAPRDPAERREEMPVSCADWATARAYCRFVGGDLPTEAQWEYAATVAHRPAETRYPWGNDTPDCDRLVIGRSASAGGDGICEGKPAGPAPVGEAAGDVTPGGIHDLGGSMAELVLDELARYDDPCWTAAPLANPVCNAGTFRAHGLRGGAFLAQNFTANAALRNDDITTSLRSAFGFRCAYPSSPGPR